IQMRCEAMLQEGLLEEVRGLLNQGIRENPSAFKAIGYREWIEFLDNGEKLEEYEETKRKFVSNSWHYTKKQKTWFKRYSIFRELPTLGLSSDAIAQKIAKDYLLYS
ncbi:tRNA dimethylallyltransferase, partial [Chlamydia pneumoniae]